MPDTLIRVRLTPRGGRDRIDGWIDDPENPDERLLKVRVAAPPIDGSANAALVRLLAKTLRVSKSDVTITAGQTSRIKSVAIQSLSLPEIQYLTRS